MPRPALLLSVTRCIALALLVASSLPACARDASAETPVPLFTREAPVGEPPRAANPGQRQGSISVSGTVTDLGGAPIPGASITLVGLEDRGLCEGASGPHGHYSVRALGARGSAREVLVRAPGCATRRVGLGSGSVQERDGDRAVHLDLVLMPGQSIPLTIVDDDGHPIEAAQVRLRSPEGAQRGALPLAEKIAASTDHRGRVTLDGLPLTGLLVVDAYARGHDRSLVALDLEDPVAEVVLPRLCSLTVDLAPEHFEGLPSPDGPPLRLIGLVHRGPGVVRGTVRPGEATRLQGIPRGAQVGLLIAADDGRTRWLGPHVHVTQLDQRLRVEGPAAPVVPGAPLPPDQDGGPQVRWRLVSPDGTPLSVAQLGGLVPHDPTAQWWRAPEGAAETSGGARARLLLQGTGRSPVEGSLALPAAPPFDVVLRWASFETERAVVTATDQVADLPFDIERALGPTTSVVLEPVGAVSPVPGWAAILRREADGARFMGNVPAAREGSPPPRAIPFELPLGWYTYDARSGPLGRTTGRFQVVGGEEPCSVAVQFPGVGAVRVGVGGELPLIDLQLLRSDGSVTVPLNPEGRSRMHAAPELPAGRYCLVAKRLQDEGPTLEILARDLEVVADRLIDLGVVEPPPPRDGGPRLRRRRDAVGRALLVIQGDVPVLAGFVAPGDTIRLPAAGPTRIHLWQDAVGRSTAPEVIELEVPADGPPLEF